MKFTLKRIYVNNGGYDPTGYYYGIGAPIYHYTEYFHGHPEDTIRADNREHAKEIIRKKYKDAKFFN